VKKSRERADQKETARDASFDVCGMLRENNVEIVLIQK